MSNEQSNAQEFLDDEKPNLWLDPSLDPLCGVLLYGGVQETAKWQCIRQQKWEPIIAILLFLVYESIHQRKMNADVGRDFSS